MTRKIYILLLILFACVITASAASHKFTLVIDAGHGGHDAGAVGSFSKEKDINLKAALAFGRYVEANCPDVRVLYTRKTDVFVTLHGRADIANKAKADLFISIHTNSLPKGHIARGFETYTLGMHRAGDNLDVAKRENSVILVEKDYKERYEGFDPNSSESYIIFEFMQDNNMARSVELAKYVQSNACTTAGRPNKGVKQAGFLVLRETSMPSCLIELGFISTPDEEQFLNSEEGINNLALGIYKAFATYKQKYDTNISVPYRAEDKENIPTIVPPADNEQHAPKVKESKKKKTPKISEEELKKDSMPKKVEEDKKKEVHAVKKEVHAIKNSSSEKNETTEKKEPQVKKEHTEKKEPSGKGTQAKSEASNDRPVFKVQIFVVDKVLKSNDSRLKGHAEASHYKEGNLVKYTIGKTSSYNEILTIRKEILKDFPDAFIVAFRNGEKINVNEARKQK